MSDIYLTLFTVPITLTKTVTEIEPLPQKSGYRKYSDKRRAVRSTPKVILRGIGALMKVRQI